MSAAITLWELLEPLRRTIGWTDASPRGVRALFEMTVRETEAAKVRKAYCARHGGARVNWCDICRVVGRGEEG